MSRLDLLLKEYERFVALPWERGLAGPQKVWFVVYDRTEERRLRAALDNFRLATVGAGHPWLPVDLTGAFPTWMASQEYRDGYFESPDDIDMVLPQFRTHVADRVREALESPEADDRAVVAVSGVATLFGFLSISELVHDVEPSIRGRLVLFFPGEHEAGNYRFLEARDGWNYHAVPITAPAGGDTP